MSNVELDTNSICVAGKVLTKPICVETFDGLSIFTFKLKTKRLSSRVDIINVRLISNSADMEKVVIGSNIKVTGSIRTTNKQFKGDSHKRLIVSLFCKTLEFSDDTCDSVKLSGIICKKPILRKAKTSDRDICEVILRVATTKNKSHFIPLIFWGKDALNIAKEDIGFKVSITGRLQSREYIHWLNDEAFEKRTTYEVSVHSVD